MTQEKSRITRWERTAREQDTDYKIFSIYKQGALHPHSGEEQGFIIVDCPGWVNVIALTPEDEVVLVRQYRHGTDAVTLEIPGGMMDPDEEPLEAARREFEEETGYRGGRWFELGMVEPNPAFQTNTCWTYLALDVEADGEMAPDPGEVLEVCLVPLSQVRGLLAGGEITHALVVAAFFHYLERVGSWERPAW